MKKALLAAKSYIRRMAQIKTDGKRWQKREEWFTACMPHIHTLEDYIEVYDTVSDEFMNAVALAEVQRKEKERTKKRNFILAVLGLLVALLGVVATILAAGK